MVWNPKKEVTPIKEKASSDILSIAKRDISAIVKNIDSMVDAASAIIIDDDKSQIEGNALAASAKRLYKDVETKRKEVIKPSGDFVKRVNSFAKMFTEKLQLVWTEIDRKDLSYHSKKELEHRKQEELIRKKNEELQKALDKEAKKSGVEAPKVQPKPLPKVDNTVRTEEGTAFWRDNWVGEVVDAEKVPINFCSPDASKIKDAIRQGVREIPGILIENRKIKSYRT